MPGGRPLPFLAFLALYVALFVAAPLRGRRLLGSTVLGTTANGIAIFMVFGTGLAGGLLGQIGEGLDVEDLKTASSIISSPLALWPQ